MDRLGLTDDCGCVAGLLDFIESPSRALQPELGQLLRQCSGSAAVQHLAKRQYELAADRLRAGGLQQRPQSQCVDELLCPGTGSTGDRTSWALMPACGKLVVAAGLSSPNVQAPLAYSGCLTLTTSFLHWCQSQSCFLRPTVVVPRLSGEHSSLTFLTSVQVGAAAFGYMPLHLFSTAKD